MNQGDCPPFRRARHSIRLTRRSRLVQRSTDKLRLDREHRRRHAPHLRSDRPPQAAGTARLGYMIVPRQMSRQAAVDRRLEHAGATSSQHAGDRFQVARRHTVVFGLPGRHMKRRRIPNHGCWGRPVESAVDRRGVSNPKARRGRSPGWDSRCGGSCRLSAAGGRSGRAQACSSVYTSTGTRPRPGRSPYTDRSRRSASTRSPLRHRPRWRRPERLRSR